MGFLGLRKAKWKDADASVRLKSINDLTYDQQGIFAQLAATDPDARVRAAAARRVNDQDRLESLLSSSDAEVVRLVRERLSSVAFKLINERSFNACAKMIAVVSDHKSLVTLTLEAKDTAVRAAVFDRLCSFSDVGPAMWSTIAIQDATGVFALKSVERLSKRSVLKDVVRKAKAESARKAAQTRLNILEEEAAKPSVEQSRKARRKELDPLVIDAARWALSQDFDRAESELAKLDSQRAEVLARYPDLALEPEAKTADERIQRARRDQAQRAATHRAEGIAAIQAYEQFLNDLSVSQIIVAEERDTRRQQWMAAWQALPKIEAPQRAVFTSRLNDEFARLLPGVQRELVSPTSQAVAPKEIVIAPEVLAELELLVAEAESLATAERRIEARDRYRLLHKRWHHLVVDLPQQHPLRIRFLDAYGQFKEAGRTARTQRDTRNQDMLSVLEKLATEAEQLAANEPAEADRKARFDVLKDLQRRWREVGSLRPDLIATVRARFRAACDTAFAPLKELIEAEDWARFANLGHAEALITEVEALTSVADLSELAAAMKSKQARWKELGPLPGEKRESTWQRFKAACDVVYDRLKPHFAEMDQQRQANYEQKLVLVSEAEGLSKQDSIGLEGSPADLANRRGAAERMKAIQVAWKTIGPVPREHDKELWDRFRKAGDAFFALHRAEIDERNKEFAHNLNLKLALCLAAEDLAKDAEAEIAEGAVRVRPAPEFMAEVKDLQLKWKHIGYVPREHVETVWTRFRTGCDRVYATLKDHLAEVEKQRQDNLTKKQEIIGEVETILKHENARWFKDEVKELQLKWRSVGHVPREHMEALATRFRELCDQVYALE